MSILLTLDSTGAQGQASSDFTIPFSPPLDVHEKGEIALVSATVWYSWSNIDAQYNNDKFHYHNGTTYKTITIPSGNYQISQLNAYLQGQMKSNGDYDPSETGDPTYASTGAYISIVPNYSTLRCRVEFTSAAVIKGIRVDFTTGGELRNLLGFPPVEYLATAEGVNQVDITRGVNSIQIHTNIHDGSVDNGSSADVIWTFTPDLPPGSLLAIIPSSRIYLPIRQTQVHSIKIWLTDQQGRPIDLKGEHTSYKFEIRPPPFDTKDLIEAIKNISVKN